MARILILEDDYRVASTWREALKTAGHDVILTFSSSEAISQIDYAPFDIYVIDIRIEIPVANVKDSGIKLLGHLNGFLSKGELGLRAIGVSGLLIENNDALARQSFHLFNVHQFIAKPFHPQELVDQVNTALRNLEKAG